MLPHCPYCDFRDGNQSEYPKIVRFGSYYRRSDSKRVQRFRCLNCKKGFSKATHHPCYWQKKRQKNEIVRRALCSGVSQRRAARILCLNRKTIARKLRFLAEQSRLLMRKSKALSSKKVTCLEFDDLETFEHTKCKPLSITLAVESPSRRILGFEVSQMPAKGRLTKLAIKKYGFRRDFRSQGRAKLFSKIKEYISPKALIKSDSNPHYRNDVKRFFPDCHHETFLGRRGAMTGQGELKKVKFDPLFSLNHTCAKFRADINRLFRRTWCTTKNPNRLTDHLAIYAHYHNEHLAK